MSLRRFYASVGRLRRLTQDQILRHKREQRKKRFSCSADHEQDWQPYPVDPYSAISDDHSYVHKLQQLFEFKATWRRRCGHWVVGLKRDGAEFYAVLKQLFLRMSGVLPQKILLVSRLGGLPHRQKRQFCS